MKQIVEPKACDPKSDESLDALIRLASSSANWTERDARYLIDKIDQLLEAGTWHRRLQGEPKTWERFCDEVLGYEAGYIQKIREGIQILEGEGVLNPSAKEAYERTLRKRGRPTKEEAEKGVITPFSGQRGSTNTSYLKARLKRDAPDFYARLDEFPNVRAAAIEAGIVKDHIFIPADPVRAARIIRKHFTREQINELRNLLDDA